MIRQKTKEKSAEDLNKKTTYLLKIVDRSGSMNSVEKEMRHLLNQNIAQDMENVDKLGETYLTLITFNNEVEFILNKVPLSEVEGQVSREQTLSRGMTALYDAIGAAIESVSRVDLSGNVGFLVEIYSDGLENQSTKYTGKNLAEQIEILKKTGKWTFQYYGCDDNAIKEATTLNLPTSKFIKSTEGFLELSGELSTQKANYYKARGIGISATASLIDATPVETGDKN